MPTKRSVSTLQRGPVLQAAKKACLDTIESEEICVLTYENLVSSSLEKRYKRFLGDVRLNGEADTVTTIHVPNTGPMTGLLDNLPTTGMLSKSSNAKRKYAHTLEWIDDGNTFVGVHSAKANAFVKVLLQQNAIPELLPYEEVKAEVKYGSENSRIDFLLERPDGKQSVYVEVKSVTLAEDYDDEATQKGRIALFPDTVSDRAQRHVRELIKMVEKGKEAALVFVIHRGDCDAFAPCYAKDPKYASLVAEAVAVGVKAVAVVCDLDREEKRVVYKGTVPLRLEYGKP